MNNLALETREGLPDALRVLLAEYPRAGWETDPGFDELTRFWLDRHLMFRKILAAMTQTTETLLDRDMDPQAFANATSRYGGMFVEQLHHHHTVEDTHYFPQLMGKDDRLARGFDILDADHHAIDRHLADFVDDANGALRALSDRDALQGAAGTFHATLTRVTGLLDRHLTDEEELIVPIILRYGA